MPEEHCACLAFRVFKRTIMKSMGLLFVPFIVFASDILTSQEHMSIHNSNYRPLIKLQKEREMHRLHKIDEQDVARITKEETDEESQSIKLTHRGYYLIFKVRTANYLLIINALDGTIMEEERNKD
jgi:hypothetical protein